MRWTIGKKLALGFGTIIVLMIVSTAIAYLNANRIDRSIEEVTDRAIPAALASQDVLIDVNRSSSALRGYLLLGADPAAAQNYKNDRADAWSAVEKSLARLGEISRNWTSTADKQRFAELQQLIAELRPVQQSVEEVAFTNENNKSSRLATTEVEPRAAKMIAAASVLIDEQASRPISEGNRKLLTDLISLRGSLTLGLTSLQAYAQTNGDQFRNQFQQQWQLQKKALGNIVAHSDELDPKQRPAWEEYRRLTAEIEPKNEQALALRTAKDCDQAQHLMEAGTVPLTQSIKKVANEIVASTDEHMREQTRDLQAAGNALTLSLMLATAVAVLIAIGVAGLLSRKIAASVRMLAERASAIAAGDLTGTALRMRSNDEVGELSRSFDTMQTGLRDLAGQVHSVTENVNAAAVQISSSTQQQSSSTREQAATVQQITSTMQEISQAGAQIVERARALSAAAEASASASAAGMESVRETARTMEAIREQVEDVAENIVAVSEKTQTIGDIVATVNEVAEQSNLLALNATIEAVSAGEQGSRFSVVATEMKSLADQAKRCTVQVRDILGDIQKGINKSVMLTEEAVKRVESGREKASVTEDTIRQLSETTENSVQAFQQILAATNQQQIGFEQVTQGMEDIRVAAQQTATGTSQLTQAVSNLTALSRQLKSAVGSYQV